MLVEGGAMGMLWSGCGGTAPIAHAEYSIDGGPWQFISPVGELSDAQTERYDALVDLPSPPPAGTTSPGQHVIAVRVYDRVDNMASTKAVVH